MTKGAGNEDTATAMAFKLQECQKKWRRIRGEPKELQDLLMGLEYKDGVMIPRENHHEAAAS